MARTFKLEIMTPTREFLQTEAEVVTVTCVDGELSVLAGHTPMVAALGVGTLKLKENDEWREAFHSVGFLEVRSDEVLIFAQTCEWPEEIDDRRAEEAKERAVAKLNQKLSAIEHRQTAISLTRAMTRLKVKGSHEHHRP